MKSHPWFLVFILIFMLAAPLGAESKNFSSKKNNPVPSLQAPLGNLTVGERLVFDVSWMGIPVGVGTLVVKEKTNLRGREAYHVIATAKTNDFLSKIYPIYDEVHSWIDAEKFRSLEFKKELKEGRYRAEERMIYDYQAKKIFYESLLNKSKKEFELAADVQDFLSAFYWFRTQAVEAGKSLYTVVNSEEQNWDLELKVLRVEVKELKGRRVIPALVVEPKTRLKGMLYDRGKAWVYFSADQKRLPIWVTLKTPFGPVVGVLRLSD